ncbi:MAG: hypothetical protein WBG30_05120 [Psychrilyobacter sp.]|uniref:YczE/YyaS/YitT family protein n=1 Tax=Psychrilyobacter sp. TaxID=2586924 RepID=UPI003C78B52D
MDFIFNKNRISNKKLTIKIFFLILGLIHIGIGAALFVLSNVGSDPFNVFMQGISNHTILTIGMANSMVSLIWFMIIFFVSRKYIRLGTVFSVFILGPMIDLAMFVFSPIINNELPFSMRIITMLIGCNIIAFGVAVVYNVNLGMVPNDIMSVMIAEKTKFQFRWVRITYDVSIVVIGFLMGGVFGIGTIVCAVLTGPLIQFFMPISKKYITKYIT